MLHCVITVLLQELQAMMERAAAQQAETERELPEDVFWFATQVEIFQQKTMPTQMRSPRL